LLPLLPEAGKADADDADAPPIAADKGLVS
jgi:hypothetical protein